MNNKLAALLLTIFASAVLDISAEDFTPIQTVEIRDRAFHVNGKPFFPLMTWLQNARNFPILQECGMNATAGYPSRATGTNDLTDYLSSAEKSGLYAVMPFNPRLRGHPALLGYIHDDEPDLPRKVGDKYAPRAMPEETMLKYRAVKAADSTRPLFMTLTGHFHPFFKQFTDEQRALYPQYIEAADVVGFDIYPIYGWNKPEWLHLVHEGTDRLVKLAGPRPVYGWIETSKGGQWTGELERQKEVKPEHIRAEVWMSICRGATAIGYFTHIWKPQYAQFGVPEENRKELKEINNQITRLTPAILGAQSSQRCSIDSSEDVKLDLMARQSSADLYLFTVNFDERARETMGAIKVEGLKAGDRVEVVDENRTIKAIDGAFKDSFAPLAVHIYKLNGLVAGR